MNEQQQRFYRAITEMEQEGDVGPLDPALEERLVGGVMRELRTQQVRRRWVAATAMMAAAACLAIVVGLRYPGGALPTYQASIASDEKVLASPAAAPRSQATLALDSMLSLDLRPQVTVGGAVQAWVFLQKDGRLYPRPVPLTYEPKGMIRLRAPVAELTDHAPGHFELILAIGHPGSQPPLSEIEQALAQKSAKSESGWQVLRQPLDVTPH
jgi:hypothetical protein